ncbi:MAG: cell division protein SepF [Candidatus Nanoarchaeia archaeon]
MVFDKLRRRFQKEEEESPEFIEIDLNEKDSGSKVIVKTFTLKSYDDINPILNALRSGYTIAVIDIKQLKSKDAVELKRAISKIKKTVEALEGNIAGFGENCVIATPSRVFEIQKGKPEEPGKNVERY